MRLDAISTYLPVQTDQTCDPARIVPRLNNLSSSKKQTRLAQITGCKRSIAMETTKKDHRDNEMQISVHSGHSVAHTQAGLATADDRNFPRDRESFARKHADLQSGSRE
ncbi:unnamed protein product [Ixodes persulcatus]